jgi:hypothetical protein
MFRRQQKRFGLLLEHLHIVKLYPGTGEKAKLQILEHQSMTGPLFDFADQDVLDGLPVDKQWDHQRGRDQEADHESKDQSRLPPRPGRSRCIGWKVFVCRLLRHEMYPRKRARNPLPVPDFPLYVR